MTKNAETSFLFECSQVQPNITALDSDIADTQSTSRKMDAHKVAIIIAIGYANFWSAACLSLQAPFFPKEAEGKGATPTEYGLVFGVFELVVMVSSPMFGKLMPRISPKHIATCGIFLEGAACAVFGALDSLPNGTPYIAMAFTVRIIEGFGAAALVTGSFTLIATEFPEAVATIFLGGFVVPFVVNGCLLLAGSILFFLLFPSSEIQGPVPSRNLKAFLLDGGTITFSFSIMTALVVIGFNVATLEPHLRQFKLSPILVGVIFISSGGMYGITSPIFGWIIDKGVKPIYIVIVGYILLCTGLLFIGPVPFLPIKISLWMVILSLVIIGLGLAAKLVSSFTGILQNAISKGFPDNVSTYSMVSALFSASCSAGAFIGPSVGGYMLEKIGYPKGTMIIFFEEACFLILLLTWHGFRHFSRKSQNPEKSPLMLQDPS